MIPIPFRWGILPRRSFADERIFVLCKSMKLNRLYRGMTLDMHPVGKGGSNKYRTNNAHVDADISSKFYVELFSYFPFIQLSPSVFTKRLAQLYASVRVLLCLTALPLYNGKLRWIRLSTVEIRQKTNLKISGQCLLCIF